MKKLLTFIAVLSLVVVFASVPVVAAQAAPAFGVTAEPAPVPSLGDMLTTLASLGGVALFFASVINAGKKFFPKQFPDDSAPTYNLVFQTIGLVGLVALQIFGRMDLLPMIDQNAGILANILTGIVALAYQIYVARIGHEQALAGLPVIGTSHSGRQAGDTSLF